MKGGPFFKKRYLNINMEKERINRDDVEPVEMPLEDVLDLHFFQPKEVPPLLEEYLHACRQSGMYSVRIIHGKGKGLLREQVRRLLGKSFLVASYSEAPLSAGGWGATLVEIKAAGGFEKQFIKTLDRGARAMGSVLDHTQMGLMALHAKELLDWNRAANLTAITDPNDMAEKLFLDILPVCAFVPLGVRLLDIGSGGGFPGVPLKIVRPDIKVTLLDGRRKKVNFLKQVIRIAGLKGIEALQGRAEDLVSQTEKSKAFGVVISKAVAELDKMLRLSLPLVDRGGIVVAMKGVAVEDEIFLARSIIEERGLRIETLGYRLPFSGIKRNLVVLGRDGAMRVP
jgi:16S rRNA (guanine527-N7)-methyltransferase